MAKSAKMTATHNNYNNIINNNGVSSQMSLIEVKSKVRICSTASVVVVTTQSRVTLKSLTRKNNRI